MRAILAPLLVAIQKSRLCLWCATIVFAILFGCFEFAVSRRILGMNLPTTQKCSLLAMVVGVGAGFAVWLIFLGAIERRRMLAEELCRIAELNHSVRNSLEVIALAHYSVVDVEHKDMVLECTNRIDQKLRELYSAVAKVEICERDAGDDREAPNSKSPGATRAGR